MSKAIIYSDGAMEGWIGGGCSINADKRGQIVLKAVSQLFLA